MNGVVVMYRGPTKDYAWGKWTPPTNTDFHGVTLSTSGSIVVCHYDTSLILYLRAVDGGFIASQ